ncbi:MAG: TrkH family potassium uptake protein [Prevotella sp.]|nr:TrkH family potassium uptake protein [Prevotella sp.]
MINLKSVYKVLGTLLFIEAVLMLSCLAVTICYHEDDTFTFLTSILLTVSLGFILKYLGRESNDSLSRRDAYLLVTLSWMLFSLCGTLPFMIGGYITNFTDAYFESISGFTTTGATIVSHVEQLPHGLLFWRSLTQWIGGLGIVFFTIALLPSMVGGTVKVFAAEATGPIRTKLHPKLSTTAKWLWVVYVVLTLCCAGAYALCGMSLFESVNYAMTTTATGGFAIHDNGLQHFSSAPIEYSCSLFCFLSGINFTLLYFSLSKLRLRSLFKNTEFKFYFWSATAFTIVVMLALIVQSGYNAEHAFRSALFQVVTFITSTGLFNEDVSGWPMLAILILLLCMVIGASSGSTSSGLKGIRVVMLFKVMRNELRQILHPNAVLPLRAGGQNIPMQKRVTLFAFFAFFFAISLVAAASLLMSGVDAPNAVKITLSCISNVGPELETGIGQSLSWAGLPVHVKWFCAMLMLVGRLEIFSVIVIFTPAFWKEN